MNKLLFFDKDGHNLNFNWDDTTEKFSGKLLFDENSSDTFKTLALYVFEKVDGFDYIKDSYLVPRKFQLFNEFGFNFTGASQSNQQITKIETTNNDTNFYSKWVYGSDFDSKFPIGTEVIFDSPIAEFTTTNTSYTVVSTKRGAILIISGTNNYNFNNSYVLTPSSYIGRTISSVNAIGIYNYRYNNIDLSATWSEPYFYTRIYNKRKLTVYGSDANDGIYTISNQFLNDRDYWEYNLSPTYSGTFSSITGRVEILGDLPLIYVGDLSFNSTDSKITFNSQYNNRYLPKYLKPGVSFKVPNSVSNDIFLTVASIRSFVPEFYQWSLNSNSLYNGEIYRCVLSYTQTSTSSVTPLDNQYWTQSNYINTIQSLQTESLLSSQLYLTSNVLDFTWSRDEANQSSGTVSNDSIFMATFVDKYKLDFKSLNIDLTYSGTNSNISAKLTYPSKYAYVTFYKNIVGTSSVLSTPDTRLQKMLQVSETIKPELNRNISKQPLYDVVFTDIGEFGVLFTINGLTYYISTTFIYDISGAIDLPNTIARTLTNWCLTYYRQLSALGIKISQTSTLVTNDTISFETDYPNVPLDFDVNVGTSGDFYIPYANIIFNRINQNLFIGINGRPYNTFGGPSASIANILNTWIGDNFINLSLIGISATSGSGTYSNYLSIRVKDPGDRYNLTVNPGYTSIPGNPSYLIDYKYSHNVGALIASNEILNTDITDNYSDSNFSTGMLVSMHNSYYPLNNKEYNILYLSNTTMVLSYQGPFWGSGATQTESFFQEVAFSDGFALGTESYLGAATASQFNKENDVNRKYYGKYDENYQQKSYIWFSARDFIRKPRIGMEGDPQSVYKFRWEEDSLEDIFLYDFSGSQLSSTGSYAYLGQKPLSKIYLNKEANKNLDKVYEPEFQQTIFNEIKTNLDYTNSSTDVTFQPEPIQVFMGFNSVTEGVAQKVLKMYEYQNISFGMTSTSTNSMTFTSVKDDEDNDLYGEILLSDTSSDYFTNYFLKEGQFIKVEIKDITNSKNQWVSFNNGKIFKIRSVHTRLLVVDWVNDILTDENSVITDYPLVSNITYTKVSFNVVDKEIGSFNIFGQTEIEDIRYKIELDNIGKNISPNDVYIFKEYDINEQGLDWTYINKKRKEMLMVKNDIYNYVGAYKSIINAINYFGYNDLELYEYYKNIDPSDPNFGKLFKVEIPDIFDNTVEGWHETDYIKENFLDTKYGDTNLFNLTYRITDIDGNNILSYSLDEIITKLQGLKDWLSKNVIPLSHKILDITGRTDIPQTNNIRFDSQPVVRFNIEEKFSPVRVEINEAYLLPIVSDSSVYNVLIEFKVDSEENIPDSYFVKIRTYKTYPEWDPFVIYSQGDIITYYDKIWESFINNNKLNNPRFYEKASDWASTSDYIYGQVVRYNNVYYQLSVATFSATTSTPYNNSNWDNSVTKWVERKMDPVQVITYNKVDLDPVNITVDKNIDPFIVIDVTSYNGYGQSWKDSKNIEIK
jgi:hypothetical protein